MQYWLVKSEPFKYSWQQFEKDGSTFWDGVRNYGARLHLRNMKKNDKVLFYHSNEGTEVVGVAKVIKEAYQDPTTDDDWSVVDLAPVKKLKRPVSLNEIKAHELLKNMVLVKNSRLSVQPVTKEEFDQVLKMGS